MSTKTLRYASVLAALAGVFAHASTRSADLLHWEDCSKEMSFPKGHRHGTVLRIPQAVAQRLVSAQ